MKKIIGIGLILLSIATAIGIGSYSNYLNYQYELVIGSYIDNAYDMNTPSRMLEQLQNAKQGMINEGLTNSDYGAIFFKKPDNSMRFQYEHIEGIIERVNAVVLWQEQMEQTNSVETMNDVYEQKMDNLRAFIYEDGYRSDWIAENAWFAKYHTVYVLCSWMVWILALLFMVAGIIVINEDKKRNNKDSL